MSDCTGDGVGVFGRWSAFGRLLGLCDLTEGPARAAALSERDWPGVVAAARALEVIPWVASVAVAGGVVPDLPGPVAARLLGDRPGWSWQGVLLHARAVNAVRNRQLVEQGEDVLDALAGAGIRAAGLKGLHVLRAGAWPDRSARSMRDLDVLVAAEDLPDARKVLCERGWVAAEDSPGYGRLLDDHHDPALARPGAPGTLELHRGLLARDHADLMDPRAVAGRIGTGGFLEDADAFLHIVAHAQLQDVGRWMAQPPLRAVLDAAFLLRAGRAGDAVAARDRCGARLRQAVEVHLRDTATVAGVQGRRWWDGLADDESGLWSERLRPEWRRPAWRGRWRVGLAVGGSARWAPVYRDVCFIPRALNAARIAQLYDVPPRGVPLARARAAYVVRAAGRRR